MIKFLFAALGLFVAPQAFAASDGSGFKCLLPKYYNDEQRITLSLEGKISSRLSNQYDKNARADLVLKLEIPSETGRPSYVLNKRLTLKATYTPSPLGSEGGYQAFFSGGIVEQANLYFEFDEQPSEADDVDSETPYVSQIFLKLGPIPGLEEPIDRSAVVGFPLICLPAENKQADNTNI
ncbi:MAG: hypothetical protein ABL958_02460 [Bdellovibrionia bacterium]